MAGKSSRMEYQDLDRITVLKVRKVCCEAYQKKLQKKLLKHEGVSSVEIKPEEGLVTVIGKVETNSLVDIVAKTGKHAVIVCSNKKLSHSKSCNNSYQGCSAHSCCHKCEDYVPPPPSFDERMFRDYCYRPHKWRPAGEFSGYFGHAGASPLWRDPRWFAAAPPPPPPPDGCGLRRGRQWLGFYGYGYFP